MRKLFFITTMMLFALNQPLNISASWARPYPGDDNSDSRSDLTVSNPSSGSISSSDSDTGSTYSTRSTSCNSSNDDSDSFDNINRKQTEKEKLNEYFAGLQAIKDKPIIEKVVKENSTKAIAQILALQEKEAQAVIFQASENKPKVETKTEVIPVVRNFGREKEKEQEPEAEVVVLYPPTNIPVTTPLDDTQAQAIAITIPVPLPLKDRALECVDIKAMIAVCAASHENGDFLIGMSDAMDCEEDEDEPDDLEDLLGSPKFSVAAFTISAAAVVGSGATVFLGSIAGPVTVVVIAGISAKILIDQIKLHNANKANKNKPTKKPEKKPEDPKGPKKPQNKNSSENQDKLVNREDQLPRSGDVPFEPKKQKGGQILRDKKGGYIDKHDNAWNWDPIKEEWDVVGKKGHRNVNTQGAETHKGTHPDAKSGTSNSQKK